MRAAALLVLLACKSGSELAKLDDHGPAPRTCVAVGTPVDGDRWATQWKGPLMIEPRHQLAATVTVDIDYRRKGDAIALENLCIAAADVPANVRLHLFIDPLPTGARAQVRVITENKKGTLTSVFSSRDLLLAPTSSEQDTTSWHYFDPGKEKLTIALPPGVFTHRRTATNVPAEAP